MPIIQKDRRPKHRAAININVKNVQNITYWRIVLQAGGGLRGQMGAIF